MKKIIKRNIINLCILLYFEFSLGLLLYDVYARETIFSIVIYSIFSSLIITFLTTIFPCKVNKILNYVIYFVLSFWFSLQFTFKSSIKTFFTISLFKISDQAVGFIGEFFYIILKNLYGIIIFFLPFILLIVCRQKIDYEVEKEGRLYLISYLVIAPLVYFGYTYYLKYRDNSTISLYDLYYNTDNIPLSIQRLGLLPSTGLDVYRSVFGFEEKIIKVEYEEEDNEEEIFSYGENKLNLKLDSNLSSVVKEYIENNQGTKKNKYTSIFEDKNLIFIVAESFSTIGVNEELTPTLYKLTNSGFIFENFYVPYYLSTIGGEFSAVTGIYPDTSTLSTWRSGNNSFPFGLSNVFENKGYNTYAYHNHSGYFQDRYKYLKSIGFDNFKACYMGLDINCDMWPESDVEMIEKTYGEYINSDKPFLAYYMTVSGHLEYNFSGNSIASKNRNLVDNLPYSDSAKAYLATQIELDKSLKLLIDKLEENNILEDTVIVLLADHYPYGLTLDEMNELSSYERDGLFEINHNSLIIWNENLNTIRVSKVGMPTDVIPTVYNLFGIDYDSRLYVGNDLLSTADGLVILGNRSWITDNGKYSSVDNTYSGIEDTGYVDKINSIVANKIAFSKSIISTDGYKYISVE